MEINKRVERIIAEVATSKSEFAQKTGISAVILSHISSGRNKVSLNAVEQILKAYPQLSTDYLVLGQGSMFKESGSRKVTDQLESLSRALSITSNQHQKSIDEHIKQLEQLIQSLEP